MISKNEWNDHFVKMIFVLTTFQSTFKCVQVTLAHSSDLPFLVLDDDDDVWFALWLFVKLLPHKGMLEQLVFKNNLESIGYII